MRFKEGTKLAYVLASTFAWMCERKGLTHQPIGWENVQCTQACFPPFSFLEGSLGAPCLFDIIGFFTPYWSNK